MRATLWKPLPILLLMTLAGCTTSSDELDRDADGSTAATDCDDTDAAVNPNADEICDEIDNNCNGSIDESVSTTFYADRDGDGHGDPATSSTACAQPTGYVTSLDDCDDTSAQIHVGATELCDNLDNDCDGSVDDGLSYTSWHPDDDGDGFGDESSSITSCTQPDGSVDNGEDCDDGDAAINPNGTELCNEIDDDCSGEADEGLAERWYLDYDDDGYGDSSEIVDSCSQPAHSSSIGTDCNDADASIHPTASETCNNRDDDCDGQADEGLLTVWYTDLDDDGYGDPDSSSTSCIQPVDGVADHTDCDDTDADVNPAAEEICNGIDDNCSDAIDEGLSSTWYRDSDGDGYGSASTTSTACAQPSGYVASAGDCNDSESSIHPTATEQCNEVDDDCDGQTDDGVTDSTWYKDNDGDGYGGSSNTVIDCRMPTGYSAYNTDCNDAASTIHPNATESCNGTDDDCDGEIDESVILTWYQDSDSDGYGNSAKSTTACSQPDGYVTDKTDCNDTSNAIHPNASETCNHLDDDCDGSTDDGLTTSTYYQDSDQDGFGNPDISKIDCMAPSGYVLDDTDCDDATEETNPNAAESCNSLDDNCNGETDEGVKSTWYKDADSDGYGNPDKSTQSCTKPSGYSSNANDCNDGNSSINPGVTESCNDLDDDCDGDVDEDAEYNYYPDDDGDGYGASSGSILACTAPEGYVGNNQDCDDTSYVSHPGGSEICNGNDDNCDGTIDVQDGSVCEYLVTPIPYSTHAYMFVTGSDTWENAEAYCESYGYYLFESNDSYENDIIYMSAYELYSSYSNWWIGASDIDQEGTFTWIDGSSLSYSNWGGGEPNNDGNEDCGEFTVWSGQWNDRNCSDHLAFVCEAE